MTIIAPYLSTLGTSAYFYSGNTAMGFLLSSPTFSIRSRLFSFECFCFQNTCLCFLIKQYNDIGKCIQIINQSYRIVYSKKIILQQAQIMLKLNDFLNPQLNEQGAAMMRCLKNSIKRNIILPSVQMKNSQALAQYEAKLTRHNFQQKDLYLLFQHMYTKEQMSISDRNLIRRILLTIFPEPLIAAGGRKLLNYTSFHKIQKGCKLYGDKKFYLILRGNVKIQSPFYQRKIGSGMYFGHLQLLANMPDDSIVFQTQSDSFIISITEEGFHQTLAKYFQDQVGSKDKVIPKILKERLQPIQVLLICQEMKRKSYPIGNKINKKGDTITELIFIQEGKLNQNFEIEQYKKLKTNEVVGLTQLILDKKHFMSDHFVLEQIKAFSIEYDKFTKIVERQLLLNIKNQLKFSSTAGQNVILTKRSKTQFAQTQGQGQKTKSQLEHESILKFMRIRKVNLPYTKVKNMVCAESQFRQSTQAATKRSQAKVKYQASFVFIDNSRTKAQTKTPDRKNSRYNKNKSQFMLREQDNLSQTRSNKRYLNYFQVPSLSQYKQSN